MAKDNTKKPRQGQFDFILFIDVLIMLAFGLIMVLSASSPKALSESGNSYKYVQTQAISAVAGIFAMILISKINYKFWGKLYRPIYVISIILLFAVLIPKIGHSANGATRWIKITESLTFQPSEIVKVGMIIFFSRYFTENIDKMGKFWHGFFIPLLYVAPIILILVVVQSHLSAAGVIGIIVCILMLMAGTKIRYFLTAGLAGAGALGAGLYFASKFLNKGSYRFGRVETFLDPWSDPTDKGFQIVQSLYAIGSGGLFGVGLGNSTQKYLYLPEPQNDFIFAIIAEELGFIGCLVVIILFGIFIWRGVVIAMKARDTFGSLVAIGITSLIGIQALINIAVVTSSMPNTGMPLPFFSYGGTALLILLCTVGILLNISRYQKQ